MSWFSKVRDRIKDYADPKKKVKALINPAGATAHVLFGQAGKDPAGLDKYANPKIPEVPDTPAAPRIDEAAIARQQSDRSRRRKGVFANLFAGAGGGSSTLG